MGYFTPAFSGAQTTVKLLCNHCIPGGPQRLAQGENWNRLPLLRGPQSKGDKIRIGCLTLAFSGAQKRAELLHNPCILGGPKRQAQGENQNWLPNPCLLRGPESKEENITIGYLTPALSGA